MVTLDAGVDFPLPTASSSPLSLLTYSQQQTHTMFHVASPYTASLKGQTVSIKVTMSIANTCEIHFKTFTSFFISRASKSVYR